MSDELSPLSRFVLRGLKTCWLPDRGWWSHAYRTDRGENISKPESDVFYSLNVVLGLSQLQQTPTDLPWNRDEVFERCCLALHDHPVPVYAYGMALWAAVEADLPVPGSTLDGLRRLLDDRDGWTRWKAQDVGLVLSGLSHLVRREREPWTKYAEALFAFATERFANTGTGLFLNNVHRVRGRYATFATGVYLTLGHFHYGEAFGNHHAIARALQAVNVLASHQGPYGEWPWYYDALTGSVLDPYAVYSVHQDGMAPAYLHLAARHGRADANMQITRGFRWILGENQLGATMLDPRGLILRSQYRAERGERVRRAIRAVVRAHLRRSGHYVDAARVAVLPECRSYHLGWVLWSFAGRPEFEELTHHRLIKQALADHDGS